MDMSHFVIYSQMSWWNCRLFPHLANLNDAAMSIHVQLFMWTHVFTVHRYISRKSGCAVSYSISKESMRVSVSSHPHQHLIFSIFLITVIIVGVRYYLIMALIYISLMIHSIENIVMWFLALCHFFLWNAYSNILPHLKLDDIFSYY